MHIRMLIKSQSEVRLHTERSVHFHPSRCARPSFSIFRGSGSETREVPCHVAVQWYMHVENSLWSVAEANQHLRTQRWWWVRGGRGRRRGLETNCKLFGLRVGGGASVGYHPHAVWDGPQKHLASYPSCSLVAWVRGQEVSQTETSS